MSEKNAFSIGEIARVIGGGTPTRSNSEFYDGEIPWVTPKDMKRWWISDSQIRITESGLEQSSARLAPERSVLVVVRSGVLKHTLPVAIARRAVAINQDMKALICSASVEPGFLAYFIKWRSPEILQWVRATTADNFSFSKLLEMAIPLPSLDKQRRVVSLLDQVESLRAKRRAAIALLDELAQSIFLDMFGDPVANPKQWGKLALAEILERIDSGKSPVCLERPAELDEWGVLKLGSVTQCVFLPEENKALKEESYTVDHEVKAGDLLFTRKNTPELVAAVAYVRNPRPRLLLPDLIFRLVPKADAPVSKVFLHGLLAFPTQRRKVRALASGSALSMSNISKAKLLKLEVPLPPVDLQRSYARQIDAIEGLKQRHQAHLAELDALFASLQDRAFRGTLWTEESAPVA